MAIRFMRVLFKFTVYELLRKADVLAERYFQKINKTPFVKAIGVDENEHRALRR